MKKLISGILAVILTLCLIPLSAAAATNPSYSKIKISNVTKDNVKITANIDNPSKLKIVKGGFYYGTTSGDVKTSGTKITDSVPKNWQKAKSLPCSYDFKNEYGLVLKSNTTYYVVLYCTDSKGKSYYSDERSFTTQGAPVSGENVISSECIEAAIAWASDVLDPYSENGYMGYCAALVTDAYQDGAGLTNALRANTASLLGDALITNTDTNPPRGALVFWKADCSAGHVALSLGDGKVIHPWASNRAVTKISEVTKWYESTLGLKNNYRGWGAPIAGYTLATAEN